MTRGFSHLQSIFHCVWNRPGPISRIRCWIQLKWRTIHVFIWNSTVFLTILPLLFFHFPVWLFLHHSYSILEIVLWDPSTGLGGSLEWRSTLPVLRSLSAFRWWECEDEAVSPSRTLSHRSERGERACERMRVNRHLFLPPPIVLLSPASYQISPSSSLLCPFPLHSFTWFDVVPSWMGALVTVSSFHTHPRRPERAREQGKWGDADDWIAPLERGEGGRVLYPICDSWPAHVSFPKNILKS